MGTARFDDGTIDCPKFDVAGPVASWMWFCGVLYCRRALTDGFVPKSKVPTLVPAISTNAAFRSAAKLVEARLWHDAVGGYQIHDYLDWNPSKAAMTEYRRRDRERKHGKHGIHEPESNGFHAESERIPSDSANARAERGGAKSESESKPESKAKSETEPTGFDGFWKRYPNRKAKAGALKAWNRIKPSPATIVAIHEALDWQVRSQSWTKDLGQFVPLGQTYLNGRRWEDEAQHAPEPPNRGERWYEQCERLGHEPRCPGHLEHGIRVAKDAQAVTA